DDQGDPSTRPPHRLLTPGTEPEPEPVPVPAPQTSSAELASLLAPLVEALREDLSTGARPGGGEHRQNGKTSLVGVEENR
ncbi:hypothetical protein AB0J43_04790, partial [Nonomuraea fuscirosea]